MKFNDLLRVSIRQVVRQRRRYLGVALAIALGTAGFITMITMGREFKRNCNRDLDLIGGVTIIRARFDNNLASRPHWFRPETLAALRRLPGIQDLSLVASRFGTINRDGLKFAPMLMGVDESYWEVLGYWPRTGKLLDLDAVTGRRREVVLGMSLAQKMFGHLDVAGQVLEIDQDIYRVTGVLGGLTDSGLSHSVFLPLTTAQDRLFGLPPPSTIYLRCQTWDDVKSVAAAIPRVVQAHQPMERLSVEVSWEGLERVQKVSWWIEFFIYIAVTATMILGGFGIWNVMMAAVRSRTREIGLKKAMGAEDGDILAQFLAEALCLSLGAALVGVGLGRLFVEILSWQIGVRPPEDIFFLCFGLGLLFAVVLGVGAGLYPSLQASRMEVVAATRYE